MKFIFSRLKTIFYSLAGLVRKLLFLQLENKIHILMCCRVMSSIYNCLLVKFKYSHDGEQFTTE